MKETGALSLKNKELLHHTHHIIKIMSRRLKSIQEALARISALSLPQVLSAIARDAFSHKVEALLRRVEDSFHHALTSRLCEHSIHLNSKLLELQNRLHEAKRAHADF